MRWFSARDFVMMFTTPPMASAPYSALVPPRTISMRSIISTGSSDRSVAPCRLSFIRTPSMRTSTWADAAPRMRTLFTDPAVPLSAISTPATFASASAAVRAPPAAISSPVITVTLSGLSRIAVGVRVAVTTTCSISSSVSAAATEAESAPRASSARNLCRDMTDVWITAVSFPRRQTSREGFLASGSSYLRRLLTPRAFGPRRNGIMPRSSPVTVA